MRHKFGWGVAAFAASCAGTLPAIAVDPHEAAHESPPLFSVDPGLMIWTVVTFLVVLVILRMTAWKPLIAALEARQRSIEGAIAEAQRVKTEAEALLVKYEALLDSAKDESREILEEARRDGARVQEEIRARALQEAEEFKERAHREIRLAKDGAVAEIWDQAATLSTELASRILGRSLDGSDQDRLVRELIRDMRTEAAAPNQEREPV